MEEQQNLNELETGLGTKEPEKLKPADVEVKVVKIVDSKSENKYKIVELELKHPDSEDNIKLTTAEIRRDDKISKSRLWYNLDEEGLIKKGSSLYLFLTHYKCKNLKDLVNKTLGTVADKNGFLVLKAH